jgi:hypothetical protein
LLELARKSQFFGPGKDSIGFCCATERLEGEGFAGPGFSALRIELDGIIECPQCLIVVTLLAESKAFVGPGSRIFGIESYSLIRSLNGFIIFGSSLPSMGELESQILCIFLPLW